MSEAYQALGPTILKRTCGLQFYSEFVASLPYVRMVAGYNSFESVPSTDVA